MDLSTLSQQDAIMTMLIGIGTMVLRAGIKLGKILTKLERLEKDVDAIALFVGTPRAIATKQNTEKEK